MLEKSERRTEILEDILDADHTLYEEVQLLLKVFQKE